MATDFLLAQVRHGASRFALTDHSCHIFFDAGNLWAVFSEDAPAHYDRAAASAAERFERYLANVRPQFGADTPVGLELDVIHDGRFAIPDGYLALFRPVLGSVHFLVSAARSESHAQIEAEFRRQVRWFLEDTAIQILAHPFRVLAQDGIPVSDSLLEWVVESALEAGVALEINSHKQYEDVDVRMAAHCARAGVPLAVGTDSHDRREFGEFSYHRRILAVVRDRCDGLEPQFYDPMS